jgi:phosphate acetyltransferase
VSDLFSAIKEKVSGQQIKIVFPEGLDERILTAVSRLASEGILQPILIGNQQDVVKKANELNLTLDGVEIYDPHNVKFF